MMDDFAFSHRPQRHVRIPTRPTNHRRGLRLHRLVAVCSVLACSERRGGLPTKQSPTTVSTPGVARNIEVRAVCDSVTAGWRGDSTATIVDKDTTLVPPGRDDRVRSLVSGCVVNVDYRARETEADTVTGRRSFWSRTLAPGQWPPGWIDIPWLQGDGHASSTKTAQRGLVRCTVRWDADDDDDEATPNDPSEQSETTICWPEPPIGVSDTLIGFPTL